MRKRTLAREIALKALYQWDLVGRGSESEVAEFCRSQTDDPEVAAFAIDLVMGCIETVKTLDEHIAAAAEHWEISRMAVVDRCVLRMGVYELAFRDDIPPKVTINEAIDLAKKYSTESSGTFVNGILDKVRARLGKEILTPSRKGPKA